MSAEQQPLVLVVDDEAVIADTLVATLKMAGFRALAAYDAGQALELALTNPPEMLVTDVVLPGITGVYLASQMRRIFPQCKIVLFSGEAEAADLLKTARGRKRDFELLAKPINPAELLKRVCSAFERSQEN